MTFNQELNGGENSCRVDLYTVHCLFSASFDKYSCEVKKNAGTFQAWAVVFYYKGYEGNESIQSNILRNEILHTKHIHCMKVANIFVIKNDVDVLIIII